LSDIGYTVSKVPSHIYEKSKSANQMHTFLVLLGGTLHFEAGASAFDLGVYFQVYRIREQLSSLYRNYKDE